MKKIDTVLLSISFLLISVNLMGQVKEQTFEEYQKQEQQNIQNYQQEESKAYEQYVKAEQQGLENLKKEIQEFWGTGELKLSTQKEWVEYSDDKKSRSDVDFENGVATVEILVDENEANDAKATINKVKKQIEDLIFSKGKTKDYSTEYEKPEDLSNEPVLQDQIQTADGERVNAKNAEKFAEEIANKNIKKEIVKGADGKTRTKVSVSIDLAPDYIKTRASKYSSLVTKYAKKYDLPEELIYAIIHTESYFNPKAKSHAPAYGLMQLVPKSGARDSYNFVFGKDKVVSGNYLYNPEQNIQLGTAYLSLLMKRYFKNVEDVNSQMLCAIASYNTGAGNLARAYTGTTNPKKAMPKINKMSYQENYGFLRYNLPYDETKEYIKKVTKRMMMYKELKK